MADPRIPPRVIEALERIGRTLEDQGTFSSDALDHTYPNERLLSDWAEAYRFFLRYILYQGRSNEISDRVFEAAITALDPFLDEPRPPDNSAGLESALQETVGPGKIGKGRDIRMMVEAVDLIRELPGHNLVQESIKQIRAGELASHAEGLKDIHGVGPKTSALYLRAVVSTFGLDENLGKTEYELILPVDAWIVELARHFDITDNPKRNMREVQRQLVSVIVNCDCNPRLVEYGAWYVGKYSYPILLSLLSEEDLKASTLVDARA